MRTRTLHYTLHSTLYTLYIYISCTEVFCTRYNNKIEDEQSGKTWNKRLRMDKYIIWARLEFPSSTCFPGDLCLERSTIGSIIVVITTSSVLFFMLLIKHVPLKAIIKPLTGGCSEGLDASNFFF